MKNSECCIAFFALLQMQVYQIVGWAKAPREASPLEMNVRSDVPTRRHNTVRRRVGAALHRLHGESGARGPFPRLARSPRRARPRWLEHVSVSCDQHKRHTRSAPSPALAGEGWGGGGPARVFV